MHVLPPLGLSNGNILTLTARLQGAYQVKNSVSIPIGTMRSCIKPDVYLAIEHKLPDVVYDVSNLMYPM